MNGATAKPIEENYHSLIRQLRLSQRAGVAVAVNAIILGDVLPAPIFWKKMAQAGRAVCIRGLRRARQGC